ncbi:MAG: GAF domain-containing protein [Anaerolineales bacterium]
MTRLSHDMPQAASSGRETDRLEWRAELLTIALWCALLCGAAAFWGALIISRPPIAAGTLLGMAACTIWLLAAAWMKTLPSWLRSASLLLALFAAGSLFIFVPGLQALGLSFILSSLILSILLGDWRWGAAAGALACVVFIAALLPAAMLGGVAGAFAASLPLSALGVAGLSLLAAAAGFIPLALYQRASLKLFQDIKDLTLDLEQHKTHYQASLGQVTREFDAHLVYQRSLTGMIGLITMAHSQNELLDGALSRIVNAFGFQRAEIYYLADQAKFAHSAYCIDAEGFSKQESDMLEYDQAPLQVQRYVSAERPQRISVDWQSAAEADIDTGNIATAWIPLSTGSQTGGVLKVSKHQGKAFSETEVNALNSHAQLLALGLVNLQLSMAGQLQPGNISSANQAIRLLNQAETREQVLKAVQNTFRISTCPSITLEREADAFRVAAINDPLKHTESSRDLPGLPREPLETLAESTPFVPFQLDGQLDLPEELENLLLELGWGCAAFIPIQEGSNLDTLYVLGSRQPGGLTPLSIQPYVNLAGYAATTLEKVITTRHLQRRVAALQSLAAISQTISVVTQLEDLFDTVHEQVTKVIGEVDLAITVYDADRDMISVPYAHEAGKKLSLEPFPLGQGLTSILIRSQQPLMIVEDTERKALELGAKVVGASAKSWLGVPLIVSGEILGAIILQDTQTERRFDDDDLRLMTTLASQVAITIRNIRLLQQAEQSAEKERIISAITTKIWSAPDVESVTRTALWELGKALRASSGVIRLEMTTEDQRPTTAAEEQPAELAQQ